MLPGVYVLPWMDRRPLADEPVAAPYARSQLVTVTWTRCTALFA
jgi:hypothetical protein